MADPRTLNEFESLEACRDTIVSQAPADVPDDTGVVRIIGVKAKPAPRGKRAAPPPEPDAAGGVTKASWSATLSPFDRDVARTAAAYRIDPLFLHAIIRTESGYRPAAVSHAKAVGLMQIMPATGATLGVRTAGLYEPATNIDTGARLLKRLQRRYGRNFGLILGAYNAGEGAVARYGNRVPPYRETRAYVGTVMGRYQALRAASFSAGVAR
ncbi:lytic transglycosylase domain-containing protein [Sphingomonas sp. H39-1-10]|uniref:lytic transglycosylase domain-containing protein n=1 Tax=Sphingomonas pollutisoli TaxID=3030829 RepID=UPI0023B9C540|nr:lytic transglycosylase domain-containing protein [Sphingomonas pollutisoli]MDF0490003.1 lytic transglycosylase domain-containing protein [Sphingomonas pollutisoli]